jgi:hypothetical protein
LRHNAQLNQTWGFDVLNSLATPSKAAEITRSNIILFSPNKHKLPALPVRLTGPARNKDRNAPESAPFELGYLRAVAENRTISCLIPSNLPSKQEIANQEPNTRWLVVPIPGTHLLHPTSGKLRQVQVMLLHHVGARKYVSLRVNATTNNDTAYNLKATQTMELTWTDFSLDDFENNPYPKIHDGDRWIVYIPK